MARPLRLLALLVAAALAAAGLYWLSGRADPGHVAVRPGGPAAAPATAEAALARSSDGAAAAVPDGAGPAGATTDASERRAAPSDELEVSVVWGDTRAPAAGAGVFLGTAGAARGEQSIPAPVRGQ